MHYSTPTCRPSLSIVLLFLPQTSHGQRGKAAKLKKVKEKYADQDEEDRALAMEALASAGEASERDFIFHKVSC